MMKSLIHRFASLKITVGILVLLLIALSAGTIVESGHGAEAAARSVYGAGWFRVLLAVLALNLACSILDLWPWGRNRIGYVITHGSILVILAGSLTTELLKTEGMLAIWEGEESGAVLDKSGATAPILTLPFMVRLDSFEIDFYQGTRMPAQFRSHVTVRDGARTFSAVIEMNHDLAYGGYHFFQSSYQQAPGRDMTILSVSKDPGQPIVFFGYFGLVAGMLTVLGTRIFDRRRAARAAAGTALAVVTLFAAVPVQAQWVPAAPDVEELRRLPVQHDGRVMPFDTVAREALFEVTGRKSLWGLDPVAIALGWALDREGWVVQPIIPVGGRALADAMGLPAGTRWASFRDLVQNRRFGELASGASAADVQQRPLSPIEKSAQKLEGRLTAMQDFLERRVFRIIPANEPDDAWSLPVRLESIADLKAVLGSGMSAQALTPQAIETEVHYNRLRPSRLAWWVLTASLLLSIVAWNTGRRIFDLLAGASLCAGFAVMSYGIWARWTIAGRIPASNMYESLLFLAWGVGLFALVATVVLRNRIVILNAAAMSALTMALTDLLPIDPFIHPMPPVLSGTYWLAIHVPIIMVSYSVLALGVVVAHMQIGFELFAAKRRDLSLKMADLLYWYILIGSILLITGIFTGSMWAAESWGRYWGWDPKEVWSLVAFLAYMAILHARAERLIGPFGVAAWSIVAFQTILMTYLGVNFVLASGLHSYGFGESNVVRAMVAVALLELAFLGAGWARRRGGARPPARDHRASA
jgi:cytochrome c-type biogenesis protein CcsB